MYLVSQGKVLNDKKTLEENNIEAGTTIEMSMRIMGEMQKRRAEGNNRDRRGSKEKEADGNVREQAVAAQ